MNRLIRFFATSTLLCLASCATNHSSVTKEYTGYALTQQQASEIVHQSLAAHISADRINSKNDGGLSASGYIRFALDTHTVNVSAFPIRGTDATGTLRDGYAFQVYGSGTMLIAGSLRTSRVYETVKLRARSLGEPLKVAR
jgi:hypothetical protein